MCAGDFLWRKVSRHGGAPGRLTASSYVVPRSLWEAVRHRRACPTQLYGRPTGEASSNRCSARCVSRRPFVPDDSTGILPVAPPKAVRPGCPYRGPALLAGRGWRDVLGRGAPPGPPRGARRQAICLWPKAGNQGAGSVSVFLVFLSEDLDKILFFSWDHEQAEHGKRDTRKREQEPVVGEKG